MKNKKIIIIVSIFLLIILINNIFNAKKINNLNEEIKKLNLKITDLNLNSEKDKLEFEIYKILKNNEINFEQKIKDNIFYYNLENENIPNIKSDFFIKEEIKTEEEIKVNFKIKDKIYFSINAKVDFYKLAILIDDVGMNTEIANDFIKIKENISFAVLPFLPKTREAKDILKENGYLTILHMPMEGSNENLNNKTDGILKINMTDSEIIKRFKAAMENVGEVDGFNNHMGSKFTANLPKMLTLLKFAKSKNMFYVDSKTSSKSVAYDTAKKLEIKTSYTSHFLDNEKDVEYIKEQIKISVEKVKRNKEIIAIGHYHSNTAKAIFEMLDYIKANKIKLVFVNELLN